MTPLNEHFEQFTRLVRQPLPMTETVAVQIAAWELCSRMGGAFEDEGSRGKAFDECVSGILEKGETDCELKAHLLNHYGKIDRCIQEADVPIALREDKLEFGHGGSDPYMQIAHCYDFLVKVLTTRSAKGQQLSRTWNSMSLDLSYWYLAPFTHPCIC